MQPAAIKSAAWMILVLLTACAGQQLAAAGTRAHQRSEKQKVSQTVKLTAEIIGRQQCIQVLGDGSRDELLRLKLRYRITNVSSEPVVIHGYSHAAFNVRLSRTAAEMLANNFVYDARSTFMRPSRVWMREFNEPAPSDEFRVLKPNESFEYQYPENVDITVSDSTDASENLPAGEYFLQTRVATWMWENEIAERLQQQWSKYGYFFYYHVASEPIALAIDKSGTATAHCDTESIK